MHEQRTVIFPYTKKSQLLPASYTEPITHVDVVAPLATRNQSAATCKLPPRSRIKNEWRTGLWFCRPGHASTQRRPSALCQQQRQEGEKLTRCDSRLMIARCTDSPPSEGRETRQDASAAAAAAAAACSLASMPSSLRASQVGREPEGQPI